ncbi:mitochondrial carrier domain-containing protein [Fimicolochytrium jonesii]|uniref:mitochondrial carrier domain-containing protein n=1 Tax=Fimicolochytrium jonesii TaxID=1396493 RepID=UPI0022FE51AE|nr:mitochondrial carrier domain-containing protein [Fimicolochytrium jonesii]KAI8817414.1 mitochondrial carrier domain-containing protein [Fimicolochytrium jonesii]
MDKTNAVESAPAHVAKHAAFPLTIKDPVIRSTVSGAAAGLLSSVLVCPLDVLKIRIQNQRHQSGVSPKYTGTVQGVKLIWNEEGVRGLFRGLGTTTIAYIADRAIWFAAYNQLKDRLAAAAGRPPEDAGALVHLNASIGSSLVTMAFVNPLWVIRTRMMVQSTVKGQASATHYTSTSHALSSILRTEGFSALYKGFVPSLLGITHVAVQFPLYERLKVVMRDLEKKRGRVDQDLSAVSILLASAGSKMVASVATYPHEVLRTRLQTQSARRILTHIPDKLCEGPDCPADSRPPATAAESAALRSTKPTPRYRGMIHAMKVIMREEGWRAFYRGLGVNLIRTVPSSALSLWIYEVLVQKLGHDVDK